MDERIQLAMLAWRLRDKGVLCCIMRPEHRVAHALAECGEDMTDEQIADFRALVMIHEGGDDE